MAAQTEWKKGGNISFHRFPHNKPDLLQKWAQAVRRQNWYPNKYSLICSVHFTESCFNVTPGNQHHQLHKNAIPSVFHGFENTCKNWIKKKISCEKKDCRVQNKYIWAISIKIKKSVNTEHAYISKETHDAKIKKLSKKIEALHQKVCRWEKWIKNMKDLFDILKQKQLIANEQHVVLNHNFGDLAAHLVKNQQKNTHHISQYSNWYHTEIKQFAMTLHFYSPKAYEIVQKILKLPHSSSIRTWAANVNCLPGYLTIAIQLIGKVVE